MLTVDCRFWIIAIVLLITAPAGAEDWWDKMQRCRFNSTAMIGLSYNQMKEKCGGPTGSQSMTTAEGFQQIVTYGTYNTGDVLMSVLLVNGIVKSVQSY